MARYHLANAVDALRAEDGDDALGLVVQDPVVRHGGARDVSEQTGHLPAIASLHADRAINGEAHPAPAEHLFAEEGGDPPFLDQGIEDPHREQTGERLEILWPQGQTVEASVLEGAVSRDHMQMYVWVQLVAEELDAGDGARGRLRMAKAGAVEGGEGVLHRPAQLTDHLGVTVEETPQELGQDEDELAVGNFLEHLVEDESAEDLDSLGSAGRTHASLLTAEGDQELDAAVLAAEPAESELWQATPGEGPESLDGAAAEGPVGFEVPVVVDLEEGLEVLRHGLVQRRVLRAAGPVDAGGGGSHGDSESRIAGNGRRGLGRYADRGARTTNLPLRE